MSVRKHLVEAAREAGKEAERAIDLGKHVQAAGNHRLAAEILTLIHEAFVPDPAECKTRRFELREAVTFLAAAFVFGGGFGLMGVAIASAVGVLSPGNLITAREVYLDILPVAVLIIGFWFNAKARE